MAELKLRALDADDLQVVSAHLQDAVVLIRDLAYQPSGHRFVAIVNRFDWDSVNSGGAYERKRTALRFEKVRSAQLQGIDLTAKDAVLNLLSIQFDEQEAPGGAVTLTFAAGGAIRLDVECIECELKDLGAAWKTRHAPSHDDVPGDSADDLDASA